MDMVTDGREGVKPTLTFPASLMAAMIFTWSANCMNPTVDITTSTCFIAFTKLSWSYKSPCSQWFTHVWICIGFIYSERESERQHTWSKVTPEFLNSWMSFPLTGSAIVVSLTRAKVGWPDFALAWTTNFPMYPVPPMIRILLFSAIAIFSTTNLGVYGGIGWEGRTVFCS